jgi:hypothetical protein
MARLSHVARALVHARLGYEMRFPDGFLRSASALDGLASGKKFRSRLQHQKRLWTKEDSHAPWGASRRACERISPLVTVNLP